MVPIIVRNNRHLSTVAGAEGRHQCISLPVVNGLLRHRETMGSNYHLVPLSFWWFFCCLFVCLFVLYRKWKSYLQEDCFGVCVPLGMIPNCSSDMFSGSGGNFTGKWAFGRSLQWMPLVTCAYPYSTWFTIYVANCLRITM